MAERHCQECGKEIKPRARKCSCGWEVVKSKAQVSVDINHQRCEWECDGERCRYVGTWSPSTMGTGPYYCRGHSSGCDGAMGQRIIEESHSAFPAGFDYSPSNLAQLARERYLASPMPGPAPHLPGVRRCGGNIATLARLGPLRMREPGEDG